MPNKRLPAGILTVMMPLLLGLGLFTSACGGGGGVRIEPGSPEALEAQTRIQSVLAQLKIALSEENANAVLDLCTSDIKVGSRFSYKLVSVAMSGRNGAEDTRRTLEDLFMRIGPARYSILLDAEPIWGGSDAVCVISLRVAEGSASEGRMLPIDVAWQDAAIFRQENGTWKLCLFCGESPSHDQGGVSY